MRVKPLARPFNRVACAMLIAATTVPNFCAAVDFPVTGTVSFNGNSGSLPTGAVFGPSSYDASTGAIGSGRFTFPQSTATFNVSGFGAVTVTYLLSQTDTSNGQVAIDGIAALTPVSAKLEVLAVSLPVSVIPCAFSPIDLDLTGTASAAGLDLADDGFTIPPAPTGNCGAFASQINAAIAGSNNSMQVHLAGDFTPPADADLIFRNGFDPVVAATQ